MNYRPRKQRYLRKSVLPRRLVNDTHAFLVEEKFESALDLEAYVKWQSECRGQLHWNDDFIKRHRMILNAEGCEELRYYKITPAEIADMCISPAVVAYLLLDNLMNCGRKSHLTRAATRRTTEIFVEAAQQSVTVQLEHVLTSLSPKLQSFCQGLVTRSHEKLSSMPAEVTGAQGLSEDLFLLMERLKALNKHYNINDRAKRVAAKLAPYDDGWIITPSMNAKFLIVQGCAIMEKSRQHYFFSNDLLLELINKGNEMWCLLLYAHVCSETILPANQYDLQLRFTQHCLEMVVDHSKVRSGRTNLARDNKGFGYLKMLEGLFAAEAIRRADTEKGWNNTRLADNLWQAIVDDDYQVQPTWRTSELWSIFQMGTVPQIADVIGTIKIAGHPSIQFDIGLQKLYDRTHENIQVENDAIVRGLGAVTRDFVKNFYIRHKRYPIFSTPDNQLPPTLQILKGRNISPMLGFGKTQWDRITLEQWGTLRIGKNMEFDELDNKLLLLKDKALGMTRSKIYMTLVAGQDPSQACLNVPWEERRALLRYLATEDYDAEAKAYLKAFESTYDWGDDVTDYLVIKLTAKELEEKVEGRYFGASPPVERDRRITMDKNVTDFLHNYQHDQLLTPNELDIIRRLFSFRHFAQLYPGHTLYQLSFDFSKWNNSMRAASIDVPGAAFLDPLFNRRLYGKPMRAFEHSLVFFKNAHYCRHWDGQLGGIEGLYQPGWTLFFLGGLKQSLEQLGITYSITAKGDDVRACIAIPEGRVAEVGHEGIRDQVLQPITELCDQMGWTLNPNETFMSLSLICTSKQYQLNNTWLPASSKKMLKLLSLSNLIFPSLQDIVGNTFSTAHSAASTTTAVIPAFITASLVASRELVREFGERQLTSTQVAALLIWPQILGGPGSLPLQTFFVRGENDMLSVSISLLRHVWRSDYGELSKVCQHILQMELDPEYPPTMLLADPYAIPLQCPKRASATLKRLMRETLPHWVKNSNLSQLLDPAAQDDRLALANHLLSMTPYVAKIATTIWECSPFYIIDEILGKFMQSSTVFAFLSRYSKRKSHVRNAHLALAKVIQANTDQLKFWSGQLRYGGGDEGLFLGIRERYWRQKTICTTQLAHMIREKAYGRKLHGLTYPSLTDQNLIFHPEDLGEAFQDGDVAKISNQIVIDDLKWQYETDLPSAHYASLPNHIPWLGAATSSNLNLPKFQTRIQSMVISKILKLVGMLRSGDYLGPEFRRTIHVVLASLTTVSVEALTVITPEAAQSHTLHRGAINSASLNTMPNFRCNLLQLAIYNTEGLTKLKGDHTDYTINYAGRYYISLVLALLPLQMSSQWPKTYPKVVHSVLHWDLDHPEEYHFCPWCCDSYADVRITFQSRRIPTLSQYRRLPMVGASNYENKVLRMNIAEAIQGKARRLAVDHHLDPTNPIVVSACTQVLVHKFKQISQDQHSAAASMGAARVPTGGLLELALAQQRIPNLKNVSLQVWRTMPYEDLYAGVFIEVLDTILMMYPPEASINAETLMSIQPHLNPLAPMFDCLIKAGLNAQLSMGAKMYNASHNLGLRELRWGARDASDANAAAMTFMRHVLPYISRWADEGVEVPRTTFFMGQQDDTGILDSLRSRAERLITYAVRSRCKIAQQAIRALRRDYRFPAGVQRPVTAWTEQEEPTYQEFKTQVTERLDHLVNTILDEDMNELITTIKSALLPIWYSFALIPTAGQEVRELLPGQFTPPINLVEYTETPDVAWGPLDEVNVPHMRLICLHMGSYYARWMVEFLRDHIMNPVGAYAAVRDLLIPVGANPLARWLACIGTCQVAIISTDDAERVIRQITKEHPLEMFDQWVADQAILDAHQEDFIVHRDECHLDHRTPGFIPLGQIPTRLVLHRGGLDPMEILWPQLPFYQADYLAPHPYSIDAMEPLRCVGHQNTSVAKYAWVLERIPTMVDPEQDHTVICLADGLGGVTRHMLLSRPGAHVVYNSLLTSLDANITIADASATNAPIECLDVVLLPAFRRRLHYEGLFPGDLLYSETVDQLRMVTRHLPPVGIITMDADIMWDRPLGDYVTMLHNVLTAVVDHAHEHTVVIIKSFLVSDIEFHKVLYWWVTLFDHSHMVRTPAHRQHTSEFLLVAWGIRPDAQQVYLTSQWTKTTFRQHLALANTFRTIYDFMSDRITRFRADLVNSPVPAGPLFRSYLDQQCKPLNLEAMLDGFHILLHNPPTHVCEWPTLVSNLCVSTLEDITRMVRVGTHRQQVILYARWKQVISKGAKLIDRILLKYLTVLLLQQCVLTRMSYHPLGYDHVQPVFQRTIDHLIRFMDGPIMNPILRGRLVRGVLRDVVELQVRDGDVVLERDQEVMFSVTKVCRKLILRYQRLCGATMYLMYVCQQAPNSRNLYLSAFSDRIRLLECCHVGYRHENIQALSVVEGTLSPELQAPERLRPHIADIEEHMDFWHED